MKVFNIFDISLLLRFFNFKTCLRFGIVVFLRDYVKIYLITLISCVFRLIVFHMTRMRCRKRLSCGVWETMMFDQQKFQFETTPDVETLIIIIFTIHLGLMQVLAHFYSFPLDAFRLCICKQIFIRCYCCISKGTDTRCCYLNSGSVFFVVFVFVSIHKLDEHGMKTTNSSDGFEQQQMVFIFHSTNLVQT